MKFATALTAVAALVAGSLVSAHEHILSPCVRGTSVMSCEGFGPRDYDIATPISTKDTVNRDNMCRGPRGKSNGVLKAGETITLNFDPSGAIHSGGHCEVSMSTNEKDWAVILTKLTNCFVDEEGLNIKATIPQDAPSLEHVVIAWGWVNAEGNREFYMNCMDFSVEGVEGGKIEGPQMVFANYPGYPTIGEFQYGADPQVNLYNNRPMVVISGDGTAPGNGGSDSPTPTDGTTPTDTPTSSPAGPSVPSSSGNGPTTADVPTTTGSSNIPTSQPGKCQPKVQ
ncbi:hypothetical protein IWQ61_001999 [Dispira simplex]|nr:hypothetical protein IWQ61_001999 [Dispira simplex]